MYFSIALCHILWYNTSVKYNFLGESKMFKKIIALVLALLLGLLVVGCGDKEPVVSQDDTSSTTESVPEPDPKPESYTNLLTGEGNLTKEQALKRPIAIMVNNVNIAQAVQTGVNKAEIVYETEVEGGVTRLLAVYSDVSKIEKIGTVRSARYAYIDLAAAHNAIYYHFGQDDSHAGPHLADINHIDFRRYGEAGSRISNGLASEHTFYASGEGIIKAAEKAGFKTEHTNDTTWPNFAKEGDTITLANPATSVKIPFNYPTTFKYDTESGKYVRYCKDNKRVDYFTKDDTLVKNLFVLNTSITDYNCTGHKKGHRKIDLTSGDGYYFVNGTYTQIKWSKGAMNDPLKFTNVDGTPLTVNTGNSWVCIANMDTKPIIE